MMGKTTVILTDDHPVVRQGLRGVLEDEVGLEVVAEAGDGLEAVQLVERLRPNVLVVDVMMPALNGLEVTREVRQRSPQTRIVVLSMYANEAYVLEALRNGASGYVLKDSSAAELVQAIREVSAGRHYLSSALSERAIAAYIRRTEPVVADVYETLTTREREVLQLAAEGHPNTEIAARLSISPRTAETHRTNLMRKLGLHNQTDLICYALRRGIISIER
jgi:two-component system response regulator NreC